jgi:hypothetical protein
LAGSFDHLIELFRWRHRFGHADAQRYGNVEFGLLDVWIFAATVERSIAASCSCCSPGVGCSDIEHETPILKRERRKTYCVVIVC